MSNLCFRFPGLVLGILMMAIIIVLGAGITFGYFYKRYGSTRHQTNVKSRRYFPVEQQGAFAFHSGNVSVFEPELQICSGRNVGMS